MPIRRRHVADRRSYRDELLRATELEPLYPSEYSGHHRPVITGQSGVCICANAVHLPCMRARVPHLAMRRAPSDGRERGRGALH
jgi:hypothetical protein